MQVYLTPEQHAALRQAAERSGRSMTEVVRQLIETELMNEVTPPTDFSDLVSVVHLGRPTNIAEEKDQMLAEAVSALHGH
jgi:hypothetical protein